jgi:hypothetical protein
VPKLKGGRNGPTALLHHICHNALHAALSETELARINSDFARLRAHPKIARFVAWIQGRPPEFHARTAGARRRRR